MMNPFAGNACLVRMQDVNWRSLLVFAFDLAAVVFSWVGTSWLLADFAMTMEQMRMAGWELFVLLPAQAAIFRLMGLYRGLWFFSSLPDLIRIVKAIGLSALLLAVALLVAYPRGPGLYSTIVLYPLFLLVAMAGGRATYRYWKEYSIYGSPHPVGKPVLILGAGRVGAKLVTELARSTEWHVSGFLDDDRTKQGREVMGKRVLGSIADLKKWAGRLGVRHVILAMPSADEFTKQKLMAMCLEAGTRAYTVPTTAQLLSGQDRLDHVRPLNLDDLLGRSPVDIGTPEVLSMVTGKVMMVTGAGGSIGSELCKQISRLAPGQLILFENNEFSLYRLHEKISLEFPGVSVIPLVGDVKDAQWTGEVMRRYAPAVVFHAAAYKHVPLMEDLNAWQAVRNNVLGTYVVAAAALRAEVPEFVLVSTDKAVNPTNVMGASKRLAEMICQALQEGQQSTRFEIVRFGNVLGSTGSVIPKFQRQIKNGGPLTVTHPEITRFFMSIHEAAQLVLQAAAMGEGGEIFILDMGQAIRIVDLARQMIKLSGKGEDEISIVYTGLRPGEKLYEELLAKEEQTRPTGHAKVRTAKARSVSRLELDEILEWVKTPAPRSDAEVRRDLRKWVPEYQPSSPTTLRPISFRHEN